MARREFPAAIRWIVRLLRAPVRVLTCRDRRRTIHVRIGPPVDLDDLRRREIDAEVLVEASERIMSAITALLSGIRGGAAAGRTARSTSTSTDGAAGRASSTGVRLDRDDEAKGA